MIKRRASGVNPLETFAAAVPAPLALALSVGGRVTGAALAIAIALNESYDPTQAFAGLLAVAALLSVLGQATSLRHWLAGIGAGALFFGGSMLWSVDAGMAVLAAGTVACIGSLIAARHDDEAVIAPLLSFFAGGFVMAGTVVLVILTVEG